ncbi:MAG: PASTA domain-containing protein [Dysgonomonas sp.]|nr:PASTA domain-containing protein [Dysgonomonas sp.]
MGKENKSSLIKQLISNIYIRNIALMAIVAIVLLGLVLLALNVYTRHNDSREVPDLKGMQVEDAAAIVLSSDLKYEVVDSIYQKDGIPGAILEQIPKGKSKVKEGRTIYLTIQSVNEPQIAIPDLVDASLRQSETLLRTLGFTNINIEYIPSEYQGLVYSVEYKGNKLVAGQKIPKGATLTLKVGDGNLSGMPTDSIEDTLPIEDDIQ